MRIPFVGFLWLIGLLSLQKSFVLRNRARIGVDGDGIGLYFLWFEINDSLPKDSITMYANVFLIIGIALLLMGFLFLFLT